MAHNLAHNNLELKLVRNERIWELRALKAMSQRQIAKEIGVSQNTVCTVLYKQAKEYQKIFWEKVDNEKTIQIYALKKVAQEMWDAWEKSKGIQKVIKQNGITDDSKGIKNIEIREQQGDPRFIELYLKALKDIRDILGINAATTTHATIVHSTSESEDNPDTSLVRFLDRLTQAATTQSAGSPAQGTIN